jgi:hypothetical protein
VRKTPPVRRKTGADFVKIRKMLTAWILGDLQLFSSVWKRAFCGVRFVTAMIAEGLERAPRPKKIAKAYSCPDKG